MKILHVHDKPFAMPVSASDGVGAGADGGGIEVYLSCIARGLIGRGHDLRELRFGDEAPNGGMEDPRRHRAVSSSVLPRRANFAAVEAMIRREAPDLIHFHSPYYAVHPSLLARLCRLRPTVLTQHDVTPFCLNGTKLRGQASLCETKIGPKCLAGNCFRARSHAGVAQDVVRALFAPAKLNAMRAASVIVVPSQYLREQALRHGMAREQVWVLPQFSEFPPNAAAAPPNGNRILFVGRLVPEKGIGVLFDALARLRTGEWEAVIVGDGPLAEDMRRQAARLPGSVRFQGSVGRRELPDLFAACNLVAVPSLIPESFGLVGVEAMALGRPVVAFRAGGVTEWLADGETGLFARHGDPIDLADKLDQLLGDRVLQAAMGAAAQRSVAARFGVAAHLDRLERIYDEARRRFHGHRASPGDRDLAA